MNQTAERPVHILVAEDSATQAQMLRHLLERRGYAVSVAPNGRTALEIARRARPTLVISDVIMPEMDGYELVRSLKADTSLGSVPVMLVTTLSDPHDVIRGIEAGADNFIVKPYEEGYLAARVDSLLHNFSVRPPEERLPGVTIHFNGQSHLITASREQILNLLLSTYHAAIERTRELTRAQAELQSLNAQLHAAMRELESFSHSVSHDLRAPLQRVRGFGEQLAAECAERLPANGRHYLDRMLAGAVEMDQLIEAMLALSSVSKAQLAAGPVDLSAIAEKVIAELRERSPERACEVRIEPGMHVYGDARLFEIALTNLLSNAWKFTSRCAVARIEVGRLAGTPGAVATFYVRDNGAGFDPRFSRHLFEPFRRLHSEREFPGTGVGLATVRRVLERHEGQVWAESAPGEGATFYLSVPAPSSRGAAGRQRSAPA